MYVFVQKCSTGPNSSQPSRRIISEALVKVDLKLLFIPLVFIFLRSWGTIRYFISWILDCYTYDESVQGNVCVSERCFKVFYSPFLLGMQVGNFTLEGKDRWISKGKYVHMHPDNHHFPPFLPPLIPSCLPSLPYFILPSLSLFLLSSISFPFILL